MQDQGWVIAPDARGHGHSEKPHDPARYEEQRMAKDLAVLLDTIIEALSAADPASIGTPEAAAFWTLADALGADREALVAQST